MALSQSFLFFTGSFQRLTIHDVLTTGWFN